MPNAYAVRPVGAGAVEVDDPTLVAANRASFYADPVAWLVDAAIGEAIPVDLEPEGVGVLVISDAPTSATMRQIAAGAARGRVSPLRFAGANPSILAGLTCIQRGFRGPTAVFLGTAEHMLAVAVTTAADWLHRGHATHCALVMHRADEAGHTARCVLITTGGADTGADSEGDIAATLTASPREEATAGA